MGASAAWHGMFARSSGYNWLCGVYPVIPGYRHLYVRELCGYTWLYGYTQLLDFTFVRWV